MSNIGKSCPRCGRTILWVGGCESCFHQDERIRNENAQREQNRQAYERESLRLQRELLEAQKMKPSSSETIVASTAQEYYQKGFSYEHGHGVSADYKKAVEWYCTAALHGRVYGTDDKKSINVYLNMNSKVINEFNRIAKLEGSVALSTFLALVESGRIDEVGCQNLPRAMGALFCLDVLRHHEIEALLFSDVEYKRYIYHDEVSDLLIKLHSVTSKSAPLGRYAREALDVAIQEKKDIFNW